MSTQDSRPIRLALVVVSNDGSMPPAVLTAVQEKFRAHVPMVLHRPLDMMPGTEEAAFTFHISRFLTEDEVDILVLPHTFDAKKRIRPLHSASPIQTFTWRMQGSRVLLAQSKHKPTVLVPAFQPVPSRYERWDPLRLSDRDMLGLLNNAVLEPRRNRILSDRQMRSILSEPSLDQGRESFVPQPIDRSILDPIRPLLRADREELEALPEEPQPHISRPRTSPPVIPPHFIRAYGKALGGLVGEPEWEPSVTLTPDIPELEEGRTSFPCGAAVRFRQSYLKELFDVRQHDGQIILTPTDPHVEFGPLEVKTHEQFPIRVTTCTISVGSKLMDLIVYFDDLGNDRYDVEVYSAPLP